jgi:hypothetical protein
VLRLMRQVVHTGKLALTDCDEFICLSDRPIARVKTIPISFKTFVSGTRFAKLTMFDPFGPLAGRRFLYLDLDTIVTGDLRPLVDRDEDLVLWRNPNFGQPGRARFNTSMLLHTGGTRPEFHTEFEGAKTLIKVQERTGWGGTDQAWISYRAQPDNPHWTDKDGVYGAGRLKRTDGQLDGIGTSLPSDARIVFTPGARTPWTPGFAEQHPWAAAYEIK